MAYSILIVDDEPTIRKGIIESINWPKYDYTIVGEASDGEVALAECDALKPDIVITDIKMPRMDGLELCAELNRRENPPRVVILTGYSDFEYAKQAVRLNVVDYLMKPVGADELIRIMLKIKETIQFEESRKAALVLKGSLFDANLEKIQREYIISLLNGDKQTEESRDMIGKLNIPDQYSFYHLLVISVDKYTSRIVETSNYSLIEKSLALINGELTGKVPAITFYYKDNLIVSLINSEDEDNVQLLPLFKSISFRLKTDIDLEIHGYCSGSIKSITDLNGIYGRIAKIREYRLFLIEPGLYSETDIEFITMKKDFHFPLNIEKEILHSITDLNGESINHHLSSFFREIENSNITYDQTRKAVTQLLSFILEHLKHIDSGINRIIGYQYDPYIEFKRFDSIREINLWAEQFVMNLVEIVHSNQKSQYKFIIQNTIKYIEKNYSKEISLVILSENVQVTPNYLSKVFKEETGINYKDWINQYRLDKAKSLLKNSYLKVYEIAERSGYKSYKYFVQTFKKYNGCTPKQFRKRNM